jgi:flagellar biosynthesis chaperone FliJ
VIGMPVTQAEKDEHLFIDKLSAIILVAVKGTRLEEEAIITYEKWGAFLKTHMAQTSGLDLHKFLSDLDNIIKDEQEHKEKFQKQADNLRVVLAEFKKAVETRKKNERENT